MYDWLSDALADGGQIVTGNRRLARALRGAWSDEQVAAGRQAWQTPAIYSWDAWLVRLAESIVDDPSPVARINDTLARVLWEGCLREDLNDPFLNIARLARQCMNAWQRLHEWRVPAHEWQSRAVGQDQRIFARASERYAAALASAGWTDSAALPDDLRARIPVGMIQPPSRLVCCGFDRLTPQASALLHSLSEVGSRLELTEAPRVASAPLFAFAGPEAELRAAGAWAAERIRQNPKSRVAIVASRLDSDADRIGALVREGAVPGWQYGPPRMAESVDVSYGRALADYPAVSIALRVLRWMFAPLRAADVSLLLRSPFVGSPDLAERSRFELILRYEPDRDWTLQRLGQFLRRRLQREDAPALFGWLDGCEAARQVLDTQGSRRRPSDWAESLESALRLAGWPGTEPLSSRDYQLDNRWRQVLNEFARLDCVSAAMSGNEAVARLSGMARESIFQPESEAIAVSLLGPLEATGMEFDAVWLTGATSDEWPPAARPLALVSREIQRTYSMPDAVPEDTTAFARGVIQRIAGSAAEFVASYAEAISDTEQVPTSLLAFAEAGPEPPDPGWHAKTLMDPLAMVPARDRVPPVDGDEEIRGGARTIERQRDDPFSAFAYGRLAVRQLSAFSTGLAPNVRGNLVHAALQHVYRERVTQEMLRHWTAEDVAMRIDEALQSAFGRYYADADPLLFNLLAIEQARTAGLIRRVLANDREREAFAVAQVESKLDARLGDIRLQLRCDRIDVDTSGGVIVLDYKTGSPRNMVSKGEINALQLVVYSCVVAGEIAGLGLYNVDSREVLIDGTGPAFARGDDWSDVLRSWQATVLRLASDIAAGDVRLNAQQGLQEARDLSLLSRFPEVQHEV